MHTGLAFHGPLKCTLPVMHTGLAFDGPLKCTLPVMHTGLAFGGLTILFISGFPGEGEDILNLRKLIQEKYLEYLTMQVFFIFRIRYFLACQTQR